MKCESESRLIPETRRLLSECGMTTQEYDDGWVRVLDNNRMTVFNGHQPDVFNFLLGVSYGQRKLERYRGFEKDIQPRKPMNIEDAILTLVHELGLRIDADFNLWHNNTLLWSCKDYHEVHLFCAGWRANNEMSVL